MRLEVMTPEGDLTLELVRDVLSLVGPPVPDGVVDGWTRFEQLLAYDWAIREYLAASDNRVRRRPRPSFVLADWGA